MCPLRTRTMLCLTLEKGFGHCYQQDIIFCLHQNQNLSTLLLNVNLSLVINQLNKHIGKHYSDQEVNIYHARHSANTKSQSRNITLINECYCFETVCSFGYMFTNVWDIFSFLTLCPGVYYVRSHCRNSSVTSVLTLKKQLNFVASIQLQANVVFGSGDPELASFWTLDSFY